MKKKSIAKNLLKDGLPISKVCKYTGLSKKTNFNANVELNLI